MSTTRDSSTDASDRYTFGYPTELSNQDTSISTAKRLRQRLQRQQSGQSGRRYTGESSESASLVGTPTESGRCFTFTTAQRVLRSEDRKPSVNLNLSEMILDAIHLEDPGLVERLLISHSTKPLSTSPSIGSTNTFTDLAQRRHGNQNHRRSNASSTISSHSGGRSTCALINTLHVAVAHKQKEIVELLLKTGYDPNASAQCYCKGNCTASGNIPLSSIIPNPRHANSPELCSTCSALRVVSIIDQTPLGVAVRAQSPEMISLLVAYGADVNAGDEDGNTPLMLAVRESPLSWQCLHALIMFGAQILMKNSRGICPLDLAPELRKLQESCIENLFHCALNGSEGIIHQEQDKVPKAVSAVAAVTMKQHKRLHVDTTSALNYGALSVHSSFAERGSLNKSPLSPRASAAPSISTCSMLETLSTKESHRRKSFVSLQLYRRSKIPKDYGIIDALNWEQAWEMLQKMAGNPECIQTIQTCLNKHCAQGENDVPGPEGDSYDSHLGGLMHQMLLTMIGQYQMSTPSYQKTNKKQLISSLASLVGFCYTCLQKSGTARQYAALSTLNKVVDAGLVHGLFRHSDVIFQSSRLLNRTHDFNSCESDVVPSPTCPSLWSGGLEERRATCVERSVFGAFSMGGSVYRQRGLTNSSNMAHPIKAPTDLNGAFGAIQPTIDDADPLATINGDYPDFVNQTRRRRTEKLKRNIVVELEENFDEELIERPRDGVEDETVVATADDIQSNEKIVSQMSDLMKKLSTVNAWSNPLLDNLPKVIKTEPLQSVGTMLDASAKIYAFRVDHTHNECFIVRKDISDENQLKKMRPERIEEIDQDITLQDGQDGAEKPDDAEEAADENQQGPLKRQKKSKKLLPVVNEESLKEWQEQMEVTIKKFRHVLELEDEVKNIKNVTERFQFYADSVVDRLGSRRELVTYLERLKEELEMETEIHDLDEPYYHKATVGFEEGSAQSLLLKRVQTSRDGRFLLLHNKWRDMDFDSLSQLARSDLEKDAQPCGNMDFDPKTDAFCEQLHDRVVNTTDISIGDLLQVGDDIEDLDELLEQSVPTTPMVNRTQDANNGEKTLQLEASCAHQLDFDADEDFGAGGLVEGDELEVTLIHREENQDSSRNVTALEIDQPIGDLVLPAVEGAMEIDEQVVTKTEPLDGALPLPPLEPAHNGLEPLVLGPGAQPVPDDSHWQNAPNAPDKTKLDKRKRPESTNLDDSGIADVSFDLKQEETSIDLIERMKSLQLAQKPANVSEKKDKVIMPIGEIYDHKDNENVKYKPTEALKMKVFYASKNGYYRYRKAKHSKPPIIWVATMLFPKAELNVDEEFHDFVEVYQSMTQSPLANKTQEHRNDANELEVTLREGSGDVADGDFFRVENRHVDEESLVDFNNDSFNQDFTFEEVELNATQNSIQNLDIGGRKSVDLGFGMGGPRGLVDLDRTGMSTASNNLVKSQATNPGTEPEYSDIEEIEINGMEIKIRPSRVKAIVVKKAMKKILTRKTTESRAIIRDGEEVVQDFHIEGRHTLGNLLAELPDYLKGRTKRDINIVNAFSILLQMCNENNLYLYQETGPDGQVVNPKDMSTVEIRNSPKQT